MGKYIVEARPGQYSLSDLFNVNSGIVNYISEIDISLSDPDIFVMAGTSCDMEKLGIPVKYKVNGSGAGLTWEHAYYATIGETIERYSLAIIDPSDLVLATAKELKRKGERLIEPARWSLFDKEQDIAPFTPFEEDTLIAWVKADNLVSRKQEYVPACLVYLPYYAHFKEAGEKIINVSISTGAACAVSVEEAIVKGICELVERDAFMIMWRNQLVCPKIEIDERSEVYDTYISKFKRPGLSFDIYYTTMDLEIPSFFGVLTDTRNGKVSRVVGGAAHPDPNVAVQKTLLELVQGYVWKDYKGDVEFPVLDDFSNVHSFEHRMELYAYNDIPEAFAFLPSEPTLRLSDIKQCYGYYPRSPKNTLASLLDLFRKKKYDVLAVDMTSPEAAKCKVRIAKVLIPALEVMDGEHKYQYLGGKRWQQIPRKLGLKKFCPDIKINPYPHPYP